MKLVYICSPLHGDLQGNMRKATQYCKAAAQLGVIPLAPHTIFTQYLNDNIADQRAMGLRMGIELLRRCDELWVCGNTISQGMRNEISLAGMMEIPKKFMHEVILKMDNQDHSAVPQKARLLTEYRNSLTNGPSKEFDELLKKTGLAEYQQIHPIKGSSLPYFVLDKNELCRFAYSPFAEDAEKFAVLVHNDYGKPFMGTDNRYFGSYSGELESLFTPEEELDVHKVEEILLEFEPVAVLTYEQHHIFAKLEQMEMETGARSFVFSNEAVPPIVSLPTEVEDYLTLEEIQLAEKLIAVKGSLHESPFEEGMELAEESGFEEEEVVEEEPEFDLSM